MAEIITDLNIHNFGCIKHLKLKPKKITVIVGKNSTGKSTVLRAIRLLHRQEINRENLLRRGPEFLSEVNRFSVYFGQDHAQISSQERNLTIYPDLEHTSQEIVTKAREAINKKITSYFERTVKSATQTHKKMNQPDDDYLEYVKKAYEIFEFSVLKYSEGSCIIYSSPRERDKLFEQIGAVRIGSSFVSMWLDGQNGFPVEKSTIGNYRQCFYVGDSNTKESPFLTTTMITGKKLFGKEVQNDHIIEVEKIVKTSGIVPNLERLEPEHILLKSDIGKIMRLPYENNGDGTNALIASISILLAAKNSILLLEEPENHLHPGFINQFIKNLFKFSYQLDNQIIITTHSYDLILGVIEQAEVTEKKDDVVIVRLNRTKDGITNEDYGVDEAKEVDSIYSDLRGI
jgi:AAA15 family ATPase/GTPase